MGAQWTRTKFFEMTQDCIFKKSCWWAPIVLARGEKKSWMRLYKKVLNAQQRICRKGSSVFIHSPMERGGLHSSFFASAVSSDLTFSSPLLASSKFSTRSGTSSSSSSSAAPAAPEQQQDLYRVLSLSNRLKRDNPRQGYFKNVGHLKLETTLFLGGKAELWRHNSELII